MKLPAVVIRGDVTMRNPRPDPKPANHQSIHCSRYSPDSRRCVLRRGLREWRAEMPTSSGRHTYLSRVSDLY